MTTFTTAWSDKVPPLEPPAVAPDASEVSLARRAVSVVVAEDHPLYRQGLVRGLSARPLEIEIVGEATDGERALALIEEHEPDVALLDLRMPGIDGLELCERLFQRESPSPTRALLLSAFDAPDLVWRAVQAGASGYIDKGATQDEIRDAVMRVAGGGVAFTSRTATGVNHGFARLYG